MNLRARGRRRTTAQAAPVMAEPHAVALQDIIDSLGYSWAARELWELDASARATKTERLAARLHLRLGLVDPERFDQEAIPPRKRVPTGLRRRAPLVRWLEAHVGRPWMVACRKLAGARGVRTRGGREKLRGDLPSRRPLEHAPEVAPYYIDPLGILQKVGQPLVWRRIDYIGWKLRPGERFRPWFPRCPYELDCDAHDPGAWRKAWLARHTEPERPERERRDRARPRPAPAGHRGNGRPRGQGRSCPSRP